MKCDLCKTDNIEAKDGIIAVMERRYFLCDNCVWKNKSKTIEELCIMAKAIVEH